MHSNQTQAIHFLGDTGWFTTENFKTNKADLNAAMLKRFKDLDLVRLIARRPDDHAAWREFTRRYHKRICYIAARTCRRLGFKAGLTQIEDLAQEVYAKLVKNNCEPLKTFKGEWEQSFSKFIEVVTTRTVYLGFDASRAQRRIPSHKKVSMSSPAYATNDDAAIEYEDVLESRDAIADRDMVETKEALECCLDSMLSGKLHEKRDRRIFQMYFYDSLPAEEIAEHPEISISRKRVLNRLTELKKQIGPAFKKYIH